jgi:KUP system potassium uptake protein
MQIAFTMVVFPCLVLQYTGQAAYIAQNKHYVSHSFYLSLPGNEAE